MNQSNFNGTYEEEHQICLSRLASQGIVNNETALSKLCGVAWDGFNCWGPAMAGSTVYVACPAAKGMDVSKQAYRHCDISGYWQNKDGVPDAKGWTNYTPCFTPEILALIKRLYSGSESEAMSKIDIARRTRILEIFGLSLSFMALLLSLFVFCYFRSLRNTRTRLHRHLFIAMAIQVTVRLTLYIDQFIVRSNLDEKTLSEQHYARGIDNTPILCEASYVFLEYARTAMFMWMFVEGLYLHNMVTVTVFEEKLSPSIFKLVGWVLPIPLTLCWALVTAKHYGTATCWWGYNFTVYFWILEGPRLGVLLVNLAFLLNILRVLVTKLRQSYSSEALQARKAVKAALVLLPLLGLTNLLNMLDAPLERSAFIFGLWSYITHTLTSCQGLILACLYCFWNGEVQLAVEKFVHYKILSGRKYRSESGKKKCSARTPLMNNNSAGTKSTHVSKLVPELHSIELLNGQEVNAKTELVRLNPVICNNVKVTVLHTDGSGTTSTLNTVNSEKNLQISETNPSQDSSKEESGNKSEASKPSESSMVKSHPAVDNLRGLSRLRIWIAPYTLVNENRRECSSKAKSSPQSKSVLEGVDDRETVNVLSTEGCHFNIEYRNNTVSISR